MSERHNCEEVRKRAETFGRTLADRIIADFGMALTEAQAIETGDVISETIRQGVSNEYERGLPAELAVFWGEATTKSVQRVFRENAPFAKLADVLDFIDAAERREIGGRGYQQRTSPVGRLT